MKIRNKDAWKKEPAIVFTKAATALFARVLFAEAPACPQNDRRRLIPVSRTLHTWTDFSTALAFRSRSMLHLLGHNNYGIQIPTQKAKAAYNDDTRGSKNAAR